MLFYISWCTLPSSPSLFKMLDLPMPMPHMVPTSAGLGSVPHSEPLLPGCFRTALYVVPTSAICSTHPGLAGACAVYSTCPRLAGMGATCSVNPRLAGLGAKWSASLLGQVLHEVWDLEPAGAGASCSAVHVLSPVHRAGLVHVTCGSAQTQGTWEARGWGSTCWIWPTGCISDTLGL